MVAEFSYRCGQRPIEGYTIKRAIGRGGFGQVYYAISDGGKEVALKQLSRATRSEWRGIISCLNFKHPHLVHIYDLRETSDGEVWIIMEYVHGESLAQWIDRNPHGLRRRLVREWFAALARAVAYLHDKGVVHRDLKPANILIETDGTLKVGDYGLARRYSPEADSDNRMTSNIGTPHYMAPEVRNGNYSHLVDIYACGVILYEMLIGRPPFEGSFVQDILLKHQIDSPDLTPLPPPLRPVLARALEKDPARRYPSIREFAQAVEAVFDTGQVSLDTPLPPPVHRLANTQGAVATVAEAKTPLPTRSSTATIPDIPTPQDSSQRTTTPATESTRRALREVFREWLKGFMYSAILCALVTTLLILAHWPWNTLAEIYILATTMSWGVLVLRFLPPPAGSGVWLSRGLQVLLGLIVGYLAAWLDGWSVVPPRFNSDMLASLPYLLYYGLTMGAIRWWHMTNQQRHSRVRLLPIIEVLLWAGVLGWLFSRELLAGILLAAPIAIAALASQVAAPWSPPPAVPPSSSLRLPQLVSSNS